MLPLGRPARHSPLQCTDFDGRLLDARPTRADGARLRARCSSVASRTMCRAIYDPLLCVPIGTRAPVKRGPAGCAGTWEAQVHDSAVTHVGKGTYEARLKDVPGAQRGWLNSRRASRGRLRPSRGSVRQRARDSSQSRGRDRPCCNSHSAVIERNERLQLASPVARPTTCQSGLPPRRSKAHTAWGLDSLPVLTLISVPRMHPECRLVSCQIRAITRWQLPVWPGIGWQ